MKNVLKVVAIVLALIIYCIPMFGIYVISNKEKESYRLDGDFSIEKRAYGDVCEVFKTDMQEYYRYSGTVEGYKIISIEVLGLNIERISHNFQIGDEIYKDQDIATDGYNIFKSPVNGIVQEINTYNEQESLEILNLDELCLNLSVPVEETGVFENPIYDEDGNEIKIISKSNQVDENGNVSIKIADTPEGCLSGQTVNDFKIYTGYTYSNVYVIDADCVYPVGKDNQYYVRKVDSEGEFIEEVEVGVGYSDGQYICITGLEEGDFGDDGYKDLVMSESNFKGQVDEVN